MTAAVDWLRSVPAAIDNRWFLFIDEFDPHEPFDAPEPWLGRYWDEPPTPDEELLIWPPYTVGGVSKGRLTDVQGAQVRANYGAKLSMIDHWFGHLLDTLDTEGLWDSTAVIVCTDHGHYLGEERVVAGPEGPGAAGRHDIWGKPMVPQFEPIGHTPLLIHWPGITPSAPAPAPVQPPTRIDALTTNVDLHATIADLFGVADRIGHRTHGRSLIPLLQGRSDQIREWAIGGVFGNWVQVTDGRHKYARAPLDDGFPLSMWSNRWSTMPLHVPGLDGLPPPDGRATLDRMPGSDVPVIRQPYAPGDPLPFWASGHRVAGQHHLYDLDNDPGEHENRSTLTPDSPARGLEAEMTELLRVALDTVDAPTEQYHRLGLA